MDERLKESPRLESITEGKRSYVARFELGQGVFELFTGPGFLAGRFNAGFLEPATEPPVKPQSVQSTELTRSPRRNWTDYTFLGLMIGGRACLFALKLTSTPPANIAQPEK